MNYKVKLLWVTCHSPIHFGMHAAYKFLLLIQDSYDEVIFEYAS